jgi:hypothetical protein
MFVIKALTDMLDSLNSRLNLKVAVPTTLSVFLLLAAASWVWKIPRPLLVFVGVTFCVWSFVFWGFRRRTESSTSPASARLQVFQLLLIWVLITVLLLGGVYYIDRAGWLWHQLTGYNVTLAEDLSDLVDMPVADFIDEHPIFVIDSRDATKLILPKGDYELQETIVVPKGSSLTIEPGTFLRFGVGRSLISYSPIIARGTESEPIVFTAKRKWLKWGVVGVTNAGQSVFEHVRFEHGRQALINDVDFFGSLSLIETDAEIRDSQFINSFGRDGVYVRQSRVLVQGNIFRDTYKDGLDLDGGTGQISHNQFIDCGDEGIDLDGNSDVQVFNNEILDSKGGRIGAERDLDKIMSSNKFGYSGSN